jgi:hypothetical protein
LMPIFSIEKSLSADVWQSPAVPAHLSARASLRISAGSRLTAQQPRTCRKRPPRCAQVLPNAHTVGFVCLEGLSTLHIYPWPDRELNGLSVDRPNHLPLTTIGPWLQRPDSIRASSSVRHTERRILTLLCIQQNILGAAETSLYEDIAFGLATSPVKASSEQLQPMYVSVRSSKSTGQRHQPGQKHASINPCRGPFAPHQRRCVLNSSHSASLKD